MAFSPMQSRSPLRNFRAEACEGVATAEVNADALARLVQWRKDTVAKARFEAQQGLCDLSHEQEQLKDLQKDLTNAQTLVQVASQLQAGGARLSEVLRSSAEAGMTRAQAAARINEDLRGAWEKRQEQLEQQRRSNAVQQAQADAQHEEALKLLAIYKDRLGLDITRAAPQTVRMSFSLLDEKDPNREFSFLLGLAASGGSANDNYCLQNCVPSVPELTPLLKELNENAQLTSALPRFVCSMRRAFCKVAKCPQP